MEEQNLTAIEVFDRLALEYDAWFAAQSLAYQSELAALKSVLTAAAPGLEVGVGSGRFAGPLGISFGVEPARRLAELAQSRGLKVVQARAEALPFAAATFKVVLLLTVLEFIPDPRQALREATRVLQPRGQLVVALLDPASPLGRRYEARKDKSEFYRPARFLAVPQVWAWLEELDYRRLQVCQTIFQDPGQLTALEPVRPGHGEGLFVVLAGERPA